MPLQLDYFYGGEAEQYSFYRIPKALFTDSHYETMTMEARVLYGLLLDRMGLSARNGWLDDRGRVFIYFTLEDAMAMMGFGHNKAVRHFKELESIGLIERKKQGQGRVFSSIFFSIIVMRSSSMGTVRILPPLPLMVIASSRMAFSAMAVSMRKHSWMRRPTYRARLAARM